MDWTGANDAKFVAQRWVAGVDPRGFGSCSWHMDGATALRLYVGGSTVKYIAAVAKASAARVRAAIIRAYRMRTGLDARTLEAVRMGGAIALADLRWREANEGLVASIVKAEAQQAAVQRSVAVATRAMVVGRSMDWVLTERGNGQ